MASTPIKSTVRTVKPLLSLNNKECRRKVISLYKAWYRYIPIALVRYDLPIGIGVAKAKLKEEFMRHKHLQDIRVIDSLIIRGQMELKEVQMKWKQRSHFMDLFRDKAPKKSDFLTKFFSDSD